MWERVRLPWVCWTALYLLAGGCQTTTSPPTHTGAEISPDWASLGPPSNGQLPVIDTPAEHSREIARWVVYGLFVVLVGVGVYGIANDLSHGKPLPPGSLPLIGGGP
jgi:hypothetical protein